MPVGLLNEDMTRLLSHCRRHAAGNEEGLFRVVQRELRRIAAACLERERFAMTLQPPALGQRLRSA